MLGAWTLVIWYQQYQHFSFNHRWQQVPLKLHPLLHEPLIMKFMRAVLLTSRKDELWNQYFCEVCIGGTNSILYMKVKVKLLSRVRLFATPKTVAYQAPMSMGFSRQEYWSGLPLPSPGDLPNPGIESGSPALQADTLTSEPPRKPILVHCSCCVASVVSDSVRPHGLQPTRLFCPWDFPGKSTGVGCHYWG